MKVFLTGGTGFIGSYVVNEVVSKGHKVTILARNVEKVRGFIGKESVELVKGTLYDRDVIKKALEGKDACIHIALGWGNSAVEMLEADTLPSLFIFETAAKLGVKTMLYTSSTAAFGEMREMLTETTSTRPVDFYGATKASTEAYFNAISHAYNVRANIIRPGFTFGNPVVDGASIYSDKRFYNIVRNAKNNEPIHVTKNDGTQFIWAGDLAKIYSALLESNHNRRVFAGLSAEFVTWEEIAKMAVEHTGSKSEIVVEDKGWGKGYCNYEVTAIEEEFGYRFMSTGRLREHVAYLADYYV